MNKKTPLIFVIIFLGIISIPLFLFAIRVKIDPINKMEKKISLNFKRNFPLRRDLFKLYAYVKSDILHLNPIPNAVVDTQNGWKFMGNQYSNALSESKGILVFTPKELKTLKKNLVKRQKWFKEQNINFYLSVAPNKHSIYGDMIPIKKVDRKTKLEQVDSICKTLNMTFINLSSNFPKKPKLRLYNKTDSHWNHLGGYYAFRSMLETISKDYTSTNFNLYELNKELDIKISWVHMGDLNRSLFLKQNEEFIDVKLKGTPKHIKQNKKLTVPLYYGFSDKYYEERYTSETNNLKIMVFRDSFFGAYNNLVADNFKESVFIWRHNFDPRLIQSEKPNIVCYEIVERNLDILLTPNFNHSPD